MEPGDATVVLTNVTDRAAILVNQVSIRDNRKKLDGVVAGQATTESNQRDILANPKDILEK